jgi:hypothetical protein
MAGTLGADDAFGADDALGAEGTLGADDALGAEGTLGAGEALGAGGTAGAAGFSSPAPRPPPVLSLKSLSCSSLSSIRAISSQAPGRASPRRSAGGRHAAVRSHAARERIVNIGPGPRDEAALAAVGLRGDRASPKALSLVSCLHVTASCTTATPS